jgi:hypothetical protein
VCKLHKQNLKIKCMSKIKDQAAKNANVKNAVTEINLTAITDKLKNREFTEKKQRNVIYNYPDNLKTEKERNSKEGKKFRSSLRRNLERITTNILLHTKYNRTEDLKIGVNEFIAFYKKNYTINDFTIDSLTQSNKDDRREDLKMCLEIVSHFITKK